MKQNHVKPNRSYFLAKSALIGTLVFASLGTSSAFASEKTPAGSSPELAAETSAVAGNEEKAPTLLPGDFFYFIKTIYEDIQLAITTADLKEAGLLAQFAQERLAEANALHAKGETENAELTLKASLEDQQLAVDKAAEAEELEENADENAVEDADREQAAKVKSDLQHNITALTAALEKAKNPQAQASLLKNIKKAFGHLEKKLAKLESKKAEEESSPEEKQAVPAPEADAAPADEQKDAAVVSVTGAATKSLADSQTEKSSKTKPEKEIKTKNPEKQEKQMKNPVKNGKAHENNRGGK